MEAAKIPYSLEQISLYGPNGKPDWFWELNPKGQVPVLVCDGGARVLADSDLILDEIGSVAESGLDIVPRGDDQIAQVKEFRAALIDFLPVGKKATLGGNKEEMVAKLRDLDELIEGPYVCGEQVSIADCAGFPFLWRIDTEYGPVEEHGCERMRVWLDNCKSNQAFSKTIQQSWWWWW